MIIELEVYRFAGGGSCVVRAESVERAEVLRAAVMRDSLVAEGFLPQADPDDGFADPHPNPPPPIIGPAGEIQDEAALGSACPGTRCRGRGRVHGTEARCMECVDR